MKVSEARQWIRHAYSQLDAAIADVRSGDADSAIDNIRRASASVRTATGVRPLVDGSPLRHSVRGADAHKHQSKRRNDD